MESFLLGLAAGKISAWAILFLVAASFIVLSCSVSFFFGSRSQRRKTLFSIEKERADAVKKSRAVIGGQVSEQLAPFLPGFPCNPGDVRFVGKPVDFVGFPGASEDRPIEEVLIIEVKTGKSQLSKREREIKNAVESGRVRYVVYRAD